MLKNLLSLALLATFLSQVRAEVLIYRFTERGHVIGGGETASGAWKGYWLIDLDTGENQAIAYTSNILYGKNGSQKWYEVRSRGKMLFAQAKGKKGSVSVLGVGTTADEFSNSRTVWVGNIYLKGRNTTLKTGLNQTRVAPQTLTGNIQITGRVGWARNLAVQESSLTLVYSRSMTEKHNQAAGNVQSAETAIIADLEQQGYQGQ